MSEASGGAAVAAIRPDYPEPLWIQAVNLITHEIATGVLKPGMRLPPERELCQQLSISRVTLRKALGQLVEDGVLSASHGRVRIAVRDDGPGVDPRLGDRVFDPGVRGSEHDGAGLGLPLARRLARSCGGEVTIGPGPGGCFVLELPAITPAD